ncbi:hypothetical protein SLE2022_173580 [Rubroshorea leprosula]
MGCATSKLHDMPAVALCRDRCNFLEEALRQSYALADAHVAYMKSLESLGPALRLFFEQTVDSPGSTENSSKPFSPPSSFDRSPSTTSNSDSHIRFDSSSDEEEGHGGSEFELSNHIHSNYLDRSSPNLYSLGNHNHGTNADRAFDYFSHSNGFYDSGSKTPPPPPPRSTAWDYLNFFDESYQRYELPYSASEAARDKGDNNLEVKAVKQIRGDKDVGVNSASKVNGEENRIPETTPVEKKKEKKEKKEQLKESSDSNEPKIERGKQTISEVIRELQVLFERASGSGNGVSKMLDTGKFRYHNNKSVYQGSSKMLNMITSNFPAEEPLLSTETIGSDSEEYWTVNSENLSSTLKKLCMWEKKLYDEVKAAEKLRIIHSKKSRQMKSLDEKSGDARKVDSIKTLIWTLSTKMTVAVQVIDRISITINKLMNEDLWPQICELIQRLLEMWKAMLECHGCQYQTVIEAKCLNVVALKGRLDDDQLEVVMQLKLELQKWCLSFCIWVEAQKGFVNALNGWLLRCLQYEPKETADGMLPGSDRLAAPPLFLIIHQWSQEMNRLEEKKVVEAIYELFTSVNHLLEQHNAELQIVDKDTERRVKILERKEQKIQKIVQARVKRMTLLPREETEPLLAREAIHAYESKNTKATSLKLGLEHIFTAMEKLASISTQAYKELHLYSQAGKATQVSPEQNASDS